MGLKHHFLAKSSTNGETFCSGNVFDDRMFLFSFISKENDVSMNKAILIFIKCSVIKECVQYESEHKGDHSLRNSLFSIKSSFFFEDCDAKFWSMTKTATICKNYNNIVFAAIKSVLSGLCRMLFSLKPVILLMSMGLLSLKPIIILMSI